MLGHRQGRKSGVVARLLVYVEVTTDARGFTAVQIEVALSKTLSVLSQAGAFGASNVNLRYRRDY